MRDRDITARILVMANFCPPNERAVDYNLTPVIHSLADIAKWDRAAAARGLSADFHLKIDSIRDGSELSRQRQRFWRPSARPRKTAGRADDTLRVPANMQAPKPKNNCRFSRARLLNWRTRECIRRFCTCRAATNRIWQARRMAAHGSPGHAIYGYVAQIAKGNALARLLDVRPALEWKASVLR